MNVYLFELKRQWKGVLTWTVTLLLVLTALMLAVYPTYLNSRTAVEAVLKDFPPEFAAAFGMSVADIFSYSGFYAFGFLYIQLCGAIMACILGLSIFAREKRSKCMDFLLTKPQSRASLFLSKLLAAVTLLVLSNMAYISTMLLLYHYSPETNAPLSHALLAASALFLIELLFLAISTFGAVFAKRIRSVAGTAMAIGFGGFILTAVDSLLGEDMARLIAPFKYFDMSLAFAQGQFEWPYLLLCKLLTLVLLGAAFARYVKSDVHAV